MSRIWPATTATRLFGIDLPIVLGPFGGLSSVRLAATVSNAGGLGSYGLYGYDAQRIRSTAAELAAATDRPIALNIWLPLGDDIQPSQREFDGYLENLRPYFEQLDLPLPERPEQYLPSFDEQFDAVLEARPAVLSTVFGVPSSEVIDASHDRGILVIGTATTVDEAKSLDAAGVDAIVASGMEAGGHRTSFLRPAEDSLIGTMALVPQVVDAVSVPVIAAGGIADGRGVAAALTLGAAAVQLGSVFLATDESAASPVHRAALRERSGHTVLTRALSGRLARGIPNQITRELSPDRIAPFPVQNWLTARFRTSAAERGVSDLLSLWAGQASPLIRHTDARTLIESLTRHAGELLD
ncbi:MAG: 2-nitropropane dioxygenase [Rhodoglobus sp.]|nr:2-nitropropane dioxygenase [Rhodoglobus sp.]